MKRTTITIPDDLVEDCEAWQERMRVQHHIDVSLVDALVALARAGALLVQPPLRGAGAETEKTKRETT